MRGWLEQMVPSLEILLSSKGFKKKKKKTIAAPHTKSASPERIENHLWAMEVMTILYSLPAGSGVDIAIGVSTTISHEDNNLPSKLHLKALVPLTFRPTLQSKLETHSTYCYDK